MQAFQKYESYKDSRIAWLGEIPNHWDLIRTKYLFSERVQKGFPNEPLLAATQSQGVVRKTDYDSRTVEATKDFHLLKLVKQGDFVISLRSFEGGIEFAHYQGIISPAYTVLAPLSKVEAGFYRYFLKSTQFIQGLKLFVTGIREGQNIDYTRLSRAFLPFPPADEAKRIANFLDQKTAEIDKAITKKQRLIDLLKEQKTILINQAVTKGLNPDVPMRDSGVEWIGEAPEHWEVKRLGFLSQLLQTGPFGSQLHQEEYIQGGIPVINPSQLANGVIIPDEKTTVTEKTAARLARHKTQIGDIIFARRGEMGRCGLTMPGQEGFICGTGSILFRPNRLANSAFLSIVLGCDFIKNNLELVSVGSTMDNLNTSILSKIFVPIPPKPEQILIVEAVLRIEKDMSEVLLLQQEAITRLNEFRQILISNAVTGKIKL